jgi:5-methylcytosine-specific restriction enzyme A
LAREYGQRRRDRAPWRAWYGRKPWLDLRDAQLSREPLCARCLAEGLVTGATVVHHKKAHRGEWSLFIDPSNLESICKPHHDSDAQREEWAERGGGGSESL